MPHWRTGRHLVGTPVSDLRDQERLHGRSEDGGEWNSQRGMGMLVSAPHGGVVTLVLGGVIGSGERIPPSICLVWAWDLTRGPGSGGSKECLLNRLLLPSELGGPALVPAHFPPDSFPLIPFCSCGLGRLPLWEPGSGFPLAPGNIRLFFKLVWIAVQNWGG